MAQFAGPSQGPLGSVQGCPRVRNAVMATTGVKFLSDSSKRTLEIAGILPHHGRVQEEEQQFTMTPIYIIYAHRANSGLCWSSTWMGRALQQLRNVSISNNVRELCDRCFCECQSLRRVNFGASSSLERIGVSCFQWSGVEEVSIPDGVRDLCDGCFRECKSLRRVNFGPFSSLELLDFEIPNTVGAIGGEAFGECRLSGGLICRDGCRFRALDGLVLSHDCELCYSSYGVLSSVFIPDSVCELCDGCFRGRRNLCRVTFGASSSLCRVTFGASSSLERIGVECFQETGVEEVSIPDGVCELCDRCFRGCRTLCRVTFGSSSSLERIGVECFQEAGVEDVSIPDGVCELCDRCFCECGRLRGVNFGSSSSLERIGGSCLSRDFWCFFVA